MKLWPFKRRKPDPLLSVVDERGEPEDPFLAEIVKAAWESDGSVEGEVRGGRLVMKKERHDAD